MSQEEITFEEPIADDDIGLESLEEPAATEADENAEEAVTPEIVEDQLQEIEEEGIVAESSAELLAQPTGDEEEAAPEEAKPEGEEQPEGEAEEEQKQGEEAADGEEPKEEVSAPQPSEFRLRAQTEDFGLADQHEPEPDIVSQVSQVTIKTEIEPSLASKDEQAQIKTVIALTKIDEESDRISGDFATLPAIKLISTTSIQSFHTEIEAGSEESIQAKEEIVKEVLDRDPYYELYNKLTVEMATCKIKNNFLQKKMAEYFRKRKMEHVLKETDQHVDTQQKYFKRLDALHDLLQVDQMRRLVINADLGELKADRDEKLQFINKTLKQFLDRERETSTGLIHTKTGKEIPEKVIERLLRRQTLAMQQISQLRLKYIKIRNRVTEKQEALQAVDKLGDNLRLVDYEQLKIENRGYADKVEERDEELTKLRAKCDSIFQVLAHLREKSASATLDILKEQQVLQGVEIEFMEARERTNYFKVERDRYRSMINKLREETGVLFKPKLLQDMENAISEVETTEEVLKEMQAKQKTQLSQLRAIRKNIEVATNYRMLPTEDKMLSKSSRGVYKGRPGLVTKKD